MMSQKNLLEQFNFSIYKCTLSGIWKENRKICNHPIIPTEIFINKRTHKEKILLQYYIYNKWYDLLVEKNTISITHKIVNLSDYGLNITSNNCKEIIKYLSEIIETNKNKIRIYDSVSHLGWEKDLFIPYDQEFEFDGTEEYHNFFIAVKEAGNYETWKSLILELIKNPTIRMIMATAFASPLLEKLNLTSYIVNLFSSRSETGKTVACMVAMSIWGNPESGKLQFISNSTPTYYYRIASLFKNIPVFFDEFQAVKGSKDFKIDDLVMNLCNGIERGKATKESEIRESGNWNNTFLFTNNDMIAKEYFGEQVNNRVLDIEVKMKLFDNGNRVVNLIKKNHGFAGKIFINHLKELDFNIISKELFKIKNEIENKFSSSEKQSIIIASIIIADKLANECIYGTTDTLTIDDFNEIANDKDDISTSQKAFNYILGIIELNKFRFKKPQYESNKNFEMWGKIENKKCYFNKVKLDKLLAEQQYEFNSLKKEWHRKGFIDKDGNKYFSQTTVFGIKNNYVIFNLY